MYVRPADLNIKGLQTGNYTYLIVRQKAKDSPATSMILAKMSVQRDTYHNKPAIIVRQQWDRDSIVHKAYTVFDARDFSTLLHDTYWRVLGFSMIFDFETRKFDSRAVDQAIPGFGEEEIAKRNWPLLLARITLTGMTTWSFIPCCRIRRTGRL
jgi:hypothetical protein